MKKQGAVLAWLREALRTDDNRTLADAVALADARGVPVHAVWCAVPQQWDAHGMGDNRRLFLLGCVQELAVSLSRAGIPLTVIDAGDFGGSAVEVARLAASLGAGTVCIDAEYPLNEVRRDEAFAQLCAGAGIDVRAHHDGVIVPPAAVLTQSRTPYGVFTPYRQAWYRHLAGDVQLAPRAFRAPRVRAGDAVIARERDASAFVIREQLRALSVPDSVQQAWPPGEREALRRLHAFTGDGIARYAEARDLPAVPGTSTLSPYLAAGCVSPRRALALAREANGGDFAEGNRGVTTWISELAWRDFYRQVMFHHPHVSTGRAFRRETDAIAWRRDAKDFEAWCAGETGVPIVDAAMRQLLATGWMHNRLRMVTAMYLAKNLLIDWRLGEAFFAKHLVDWDFAANNGGWQWSASTGTDAVPYFRLFNPVRQGERFDPDGRFVRHWLPSLADVPDRHVHAPWQVAGRSGLFGDAAAFPPPLIDQEHAKARVLAAFRAAGNADAATA